MKNALLLILLLTFSSLCLGQKIILTLGEFESYRNGPRMKDADRIFKMANLVLNSAEFKDSLSNLIFKNPDNNCGCNDKVMLRSGAVYGSDALNLLFNDLTPRVDLRLKKGNRFKGLGTTPECTNYITCYVKGIARNMKGLDNVDRASAIAVNLCHEYFHSLGYCHTYGSKEFNEPDLRANGDFINWHYYSTDITYRVGWIIYDILCRWIVIEKRII